MNSTVAATFPRPNLALLCTEPFRAAMEFCSHKLHHKAPYANGDGHPVIIFPGLATDGHAVAPLRKYCEALGYAALDWGKGYNTGPDADVEGWLAGLASDVSKLIFEYEQPATLIGWSLGGIYARELGKLLAPRLRQVITIGTPFTVMPALPMLAGC